MKTSEQVKKLLMAGLSNKEIAEKVFVTESAVKYHVSRLLKEHNCKWRSQLIIALRTK